jgi:Protein of unknown function (DUF1569)
VGQIAGRALPLQALDKGSAGIRRVQDGDAEAIGVRPEGSLDARRSNAMTPGRRTLRFDRLDEIMPDVERLLGGHTVVGRWSLAQLCRHLASTLRRTADLPASTPVDRSRFVDEETRRRVFETALIPEGYPAPPAVTPDDTAGVHAEAEGLRQAIDHYRASAGPAIPHLFLGPLTKAEWERYHLIHCAHHLSFAIPGS